MNRSRINLNSLAREKMEMARNRLTVAVFLFAGIFILMAARIIDLGFFESVSGSIRTHASWNGEILPNRADIVDRNGVVLATNLETSSLYADPRLIIEPEASAVRLVSVLPDLSKAYVEGKFRSGGRCVWIKRKLTPKEVWRVNALGIPGLSFQMEEERVYPQGSIAAHVLGYVDVDGNGLGGVEHFFDARLANPLQSEPLRLSIDIRVQHALEDELARAVNSFSAIGAAGVVMDVRTGEILALASLPDFDPNQANRAVDEQKFNRATAGVYELGSVFKTFTIAMALESGKIPLADGYDATDPIRVSRFLIRDDHPQKRFLTVPEIYVYSSNIGAAKMALDLGTDVQRKFLGKLGFFRPANIELTEVGFPIWPERWRDINTMTIAYGHGIAISPLQLAVGISAMINGGYLIPATLIAKHEGEDESARRIISTVTSDKIRQLMRAVVTIGSGANADLPGYRIGGKTGTAEKAGSGGYQKKLLVSSFVGVFPMNDPRYLVLAVIDEPKGTEATWNFATAGWVAAPAVRNIIARIAPLLGVSPQQEDDTLAVQVAHLMTEFE